MTRPPPQKPMATTLVAPEKKPSGLLDAGGAGVPAPGKA